MLPTYIDIADGLNGSGTPSDPWILTEHMLALRVRQLSWTKKVLYFRCGIFYCQEPILIDFEAIFRDVPNARQMLREGVAWRGESRASILQFGTHRRRGRPSFQVKWSRPEGKVHSFQTPLFFWEFVGLNFKGDCDNALVHFGGDDIEESPWNSCEFKLAVNNGFVDRDNQYKGETGPARGICIRRGLESDIDLVATCAFGMGCELEECEFCTIKGSFSNSEVEAPSAPSGWRVAPGGLALFMRNCCSNVGLSVNFEVAYTGLRLTGSCRGNAFNSIISNNCDAEAPVFNVDDCTAIAHAEAVNTIQSMVRRETRQGNGRIQRVGELQGKLIVLLDRI